jgi:outer membrane protein TolC
VNTQSGASRLLAQGLGPVLVLILTAGCATERTRRPAGPDAVGAAYARQEIALTCVDAPFVESTQVEASLPPFNPSTSGGEELPAWNVGLSEAIQVALENNKEVAVLGFAPREAATFVDQEQSVFDPSLDFDARYTGQNQQLSQNVQTFGTGQNTQRRSQFGPSPGTPEMFSLNRLYSTGTRTRLGYLLDSNAADPIGLFTTVNPAIRNQLGLTVEQPLLRGAGRSINQAPILVAQAEQQQSQQEFQTHLQKILLDLKNAYWQLYGAQRDLQTRRQALAAAEKFLRGEHEKLRQGESDVASVAQAEAQTEQFRIDHLQAYQRRLDAERELRRLMGLPPADHRRLVTSSQPQIEIPDIDWGESVRRATALRPELSAQQAVVRAAQWEQMQRCNELRPNISLVGKYAPQGLGNNFGRSLSSLSSGQFANWSLGVRYSHIFGRRAARAVAQRAELAVARERAKLRNLEFEVVHQLQQAYQQLRTAEENLRLQGSLRDAAEKQLRAREALHKHGGYATTDLLLRARSAHADAVRDQWLAIGALNQALARWQYALGEILTTDVQLASPEGDSKEQNAAPSPSPELLPPPPEPDPDPGDRSAAAWPSYAYESR